MVSAQPVFPSPAPPPSHLRPSLFELLAQEQLRDLLHPVVRYVLSYLTQHYPRYFLRLLNHHEEFFAFLLLLVERHHLKEHNASLSEHFYQLRLVPSRRLPTPRLSALGPPARRSITRGQRWSLLLFLVGLPYARARAQDYYERLGGRRGEDDASDEPVGEAVTKTQRAFKLLYPYGNLALDLTFLSYDLVYMFEKSSAYRPWHRWLGLRVERRGPDDPQPGANTSWLSKLPPLLPPLLLLLKLSQWWYSPASPRTLTSTTSSTSSSAIHAQILPPRPLPILPSSGILPPTPPATPPRTPPPGGREAMTANMSSAQGQGYVVEKEGYGICPLCKKEWQNPAVLPSGWVVCWRCGWEAVEGDDEEDGEDEEEHEERLDEQGSEWVSRGGIATRRRGRCPITGVEVYPGQLRRVLV